MRIMWQSKVVFSILILLLNQPSIFGWRNPKLKPAWSAKNSYQLKACHGKINKYSLQRGLISQVSKAILSNVLQTCRGISVTGSEVGKWTQLIKEGMESGRCMSSILHDLAREVENFNSGPDFNRRSTLPPSKWVVEGWNNLGGALVQDADKATEKPKPGEVQNSYQCMDMETMKDGKMEVVEQCYQYKYHEGETIMLEEVGEFNQTDSFEDLDSVEKETRRKQENAAKNVAT